MKILAPVNSPLDVEALAQSGVDEVYCGVVPEEWKRRYTNIVSPNRREWSAANLHSYGELRATVAAAHAHHIPVMLTLNAVYTEPQYPLVREQVAQAKGAGVDGLIVSDLGLLLMLREEKTGMEIQVSTGGTVFNHQAAKFYEDLGAKRITIPRHATPEEIRRLVQECPSLRFEVFILNSGCKNIDGFCSFLHGTSERSCGPLWKRLKKMNVDRYVLRVVRRAARYRETINFPSFGVDSPCLFSYGRTVASDDDGNTGRCCAVRSNTAPFFSFTSGIDPCGACRILEFQRAGVYGLKIVGRNYSTAQKAADVRFVRMVMNLAEDVPETGEFYRRVPEVFRKMYGYDCARLCYYPF